MIKTFNEIVEKAISCPNVKIAVAKAENEEVLEAVEEARKMGIADSILVGDKSKILDCLKRLNIDDGNYEIVHIEGEMEAGLEAVKIVSTGRADILMKGLIETSTLLKAVLNKEVGLRKSKVISHVGIFELEKYHKLLVVTDPAINIKPTLEQKAEIIKNAERSQAALSKESYSKGFTQGREDGFKEGQTEVQRLIDRLHTMIERTMDRREEILAETEQQIVDLVLLMTRKVVKIISENQRNVVVSNIVHALRKVKGRGDVTIRVNLADVKMTSEHIKDFLASAEHIKNITVMEDSSVDAGGCIVETDFGTVDARIMSQLHELEQKILEISPIKNRVKTANTVK